MDVAEESEFARLEWRHEVGSCLEAGKRFATEDHIAGTRNQRDVVEDPGIAIVESDPHHPAAGHLNGDRIERDVPGDNGDGRGR